MGELIPRYKPGHDVPAFAAAQVNAGRFVKVNGAKTAQGDYPVIHTVAGERAFGVATRDSAPASDPATSGDRRVQVTKRSIARVYSGAAVAVNDPVKSDANGKAIPQGGVGVILGYALTAAGAADVAIEIELVV